MPSLVERMTVRCPVEALAEILAHRPEGWLRPFLRIAGHEGDAVGARLGATLDRPPAGPVSARKVVAVAVGDPRELCDLAGETEIPLRWESAGYRAVFPLFEGRFLLRRVSEDLTEIALEGCYEVPGWVVGDLAGRMVAHRVAQASVRNLLANLRAAVEEVVRAEPQGVSAARADARVGAARASGPRPD